ncbi:helix-turn-helix domain-containing protein [Flavobacterium phragmitis]|uniref:Regulatory protein, luxR family n=1 Tax=Flavobacterium phragmitis TaxID=739143 RepID=A0A1I1U4A3_9FLAO|nr:helix-turn-helix transcriptional regulator [Flavobacterium phragmitis]SFD65627.1 regulatory protein, luxR family [Flavobacterium phragmitis]
MGENLYSTKNFAIDYNHDAGILKGSFLHCETSEAYINAIKKFKEVYDRVLPKYTLWDNTNFKHIINSDEQEWTNDFLNVPSWEKGTTKKVSIITSPDVLAMLSIADLFEDNRTGFQPGFFAHEKQAIDWMLQKKEKSITPPSAPIIKYSNDTENENTTLHLQFKNEELYFYLKQIKQLLNNRNFLLNHYHLFSLLTSQEKIILEKIIDGHESRQIADLLFVTVDTIKTHRKNIFQKLKVRRFTELLPYKLFL